MIRSSTLDVKIDNSRPLSFFIPAMNGGGAQRVIVNLLNELVGLTDHPIHLVLVKREGEFLPLLDSRITIFDLGCKRTLGSILRLRKYLVTHSPQAIMSSLGYANVICIFAWMLAGRPSRMVVREAGLIAAPKSSTPRLLDIILIAQKSFYSKADALIANSKATLKSFETAHVTTPRTVYVLDNPVSLASKIVDVDTLCSAYKPGFVLAVGRLSYEKGFDVLINAFAKVATHRRLLICGEGAERHHLEQQIKCLGLEEKVHIVGFQREITWFYENAGLFVLSSRSEGFGNVLVEALAAGLPVVASNLEDGPAYILGDGKYGQLVVPDDVDDLASAINNSLSKPVATALQRKSRAKDFDPRLIAKQYLQCLIGNDG